MTEMSIEQDQLAEQPTLGLNCLSPDSLLLLSSSPLLVNLNPSAGNMVYFFVMLSMWHI